MKDGPQPTVSVGKYHTNATRISAEPHRYADLTPPCSSYFLRLQGELTLIPTSGIRVNDDDDDGVIASHVCNEEPPAVNFR